MSIDSDHPSEKPQVRLRDQAPRLGERSIRVRHLRRLTSVNSGRPGKGRHVALVVLRWWPGVAVSSRRIR